MWCKNSSHFLFILFYFFLQKILALLILCVLEDSRMNNSLNKTVKLTLYCPQNGQNSIEFWPFFGHLECNRVKDALNEQAQNGEDVEPDQNLELMR